MGRRIEKIKSFFGRGEKGIGGDLATELGEQIDKSVVESPKESAEKTGSKIGKKTTKFGEGIKGARDTITMKEFRKRRREKKDAEKLKKEEEKKKTETKARIKKTEDDLWHGVREAGEKMRGEAKPSIEEPEVGEEVPEIEFSDADIEIIEKNAALVVAESGGKKYGPEVKGTSESDFINLVNEKTFDRMGYGKDFRNKKKEIFDKLVVEKGISPETPEDQRRKAYELAKSEAVGLAKIETQKKISDGKRYPEFLEKFKDTEKEIKKITADIAKEMVTEEKAIKEGLKPKEEIVANYRKRFEEIISGEEGKKVEPEALEIEEMEKRIAARRAETPGIANDAIKKAKEIISKTSAVLEGMEKEQQKAKFAAQGAEEKQGAKDMREMMKPFEWAGEGKEPPAISPEAKAIIEGKDRTIETLRRQMQELLGAMNSLVTAVEAMQMQAQAPPRAAVRPLARETGAPRETFGGGRPLVQEKEYPIPWQEVHDIPSVIITVGADKAPTSKYLDEQIVEKKTAVARKWWDENKANIGSDKLYKGDPDNANEKYILNMVENEFRILSGLLKTDKDYKALLDSRKSLTSDQVSIYDGQVILHQLQKRTDMLKERLSGARGKEKKAIEQDLKKLLYLRANWADKIKGREEKAPREAVKDTSHWWTREKTKERKLEQKVREMDTFETGAGNLQERFNATREERLEKMKADLMREEIIKEKTGEGAMMWRNWQEWHEKEKERTVPPDEVVRLIDNQQARKIEQGLQSPETNPLSRLEVGGYEANGQHILDFYEYCGYNLNTVELHLAAMRLKAKGVNIAETLKSAKVRVKLLMVDFPSEISFIRQEKKAQELLE